MQCTKVRRSVPANLVQVGVLKMVQRKSASAVRRRVWRVSEAAPLGEFVYPDELAARPPAAEVDGEPVDPGWRMSSFELTHGLSASEGVWDLTAGNVK